MSGRPEFGQPWPLRHPIEKTQGGQTETISEVTLRRPTGAEMLLIDKFMHQPMQLVLEMIAACSGLPIVLVKKLDHEDISLLGELALPDAPSGPRAGGTGSET